MTGMTGFIIYICIVSFILLMGMIGDRDVRNRINYTYAFCACVLVIVAFVLKVA